MEGVSLIIVCGEMLVLVGESGLGKFVIVNVILCLLFKGLVYYLSGSIYFGDVDILCCLECVLCGICGGCIGMIF